MKGPSLRSVGNARRRYHDKASIGNLTLTPWEALLGAGGKGEKAVDEAPGRGVNGRRVVLLLKRTSSPDEKELPGRKDGRRAKKGNERGRRGENERKHERTAEETIGTNRKAGNGRGTGRSAGKGLRRWAMQAQTGYYASQGHPVLGAVAR